MAKLAKLPIIPTPEDATRAIATIDWTPPALVVVKDKADYEDASVALREIVAKKALLEEKRKELTRPIDASKKAVMDMFKPPIAELERREEAIRQALSIYNREQRKLQQLEQARLRDEQAAEQAEAELEARKLLKKGKEEQAVAVLSGVSPVPTVILDKPNAPGIGSRTNWKFRVVDFLDLVVYAMEHNRSLVMVNEKVLGELARATKGRQNIPGIEFYS